MKMSISESKREILLDLINELENELCNFLHNIENDESIPNESWDHIDEQSAKMFSILNNFKEEILFS